MKSHCNHGEAESTVARAPQSIPFKAGSGSDTSQCKRLTSTASQRVIGRRRKPRTSADRMLPSNRQLHANVANLRWRLRASMWRSPSLFLLMGGASRFERGRATEIPATDSSNSWLVSAPGIGLTYDSRNDQRTFTSRLRESTNTTSGVNINNVRIADTTTRIANGIE